MSDTPKGLSPQDLRDLADEAAVAAARGNSHNHPGAPTYALTAAIYAVGAEILKEFQLLNSGLETIANRMPR